MIARRLVVFAVAFVPFLLLARMVHGDDLHLTIYANGLGLVDQGRTLPPSNGRDVRIDGIGPQAIADSVRVDLPTGMQIRAMTLDTDILSRQALLQRSLGKTINVARVNPATGVETISEAEVLSIANGLVLRIDGRIETDVAGRLIFDEAPEDLLSEPSLALELTEPVTSPTDARVAYLTNGLTWETVYTVVVSEDHKVADVEGWAKISNRTGIDFSDAEVSVVAGDVARQPGPRNGNILMRAEAAAMSAPVADRAVVPQGLSAFHLYTLPGTMTLRDKGTSQRYLLGADGVRSVRRLEYRGGAPVFGEMRGQSDRQAVRQWVDIENTDDNLLGMPLPAGIVRVYVRGDDSLRFIGEDRLDNIAAGGDVELNLGTAFDVTVERTQSDFKRLGDRVTEAAFDLTLKNGGAEAATVRVVEDIPGDWEIMSSSQSADREGPSAVWSVDVSAKGETVLSYRVRVRR